MVLKDFLSVTEHSKGMKVCIMATDNKDEAQTLFKGERQHLKMNKDEENLDVSFIDCKKTMKFL